MLSLLASSRRRRRASCRDGSGFTLIETVVALAIATSVFLALAAAAITGMRASLTSQQNQQAGDVLTQSIEQLRDMPYGAEGLRIATTDATLASDTSLTHCAAASGYCFDPKDGGGPEALQTSTTGQITTHQQTVTTNNMTFTVYVYVTRPGPVAAPGDAYGADYERLTAVARWTTFGRSHTRMMSTYLTDSMRGLPLPRFRFSNTNSTSQAVNPQSQVAFGMRIQNLGARDCWSLTTSDSSFTFYLDDGDGTFDSADDTALASCPSTGSTLLEPTKATPIIWAVALLPGTPGPYSKNVTFTATSWAQPTASTAKQSLTFTYVVQNTPVTSTPTPSPTGSVTPSPTATTPTPSPTPTGTPTPTTCPDFSTASTQPNAPNAYTLKGYFLHNLVPNNADTTAQSQLTFDGNGPSSTYLFDYATNLAPATPGRYVGTGGSGNTETNTAKVIDWRLQLNQTWVGGTAVLTLWGAPANGSTTAGATINVYVNSVTSSGTVTQLGSGTFSTSAWGCTGFRKFGVPVSMGNNGTKFSTNTWLDVRVEVSGSTPMVFGYDTTTMPAFLVVPEK